MLTLTIVTMNSDSVLDIMVKSDQQTVYTRFWRLGRLVNNGVTFKQARIQSGDILYIEVEAA